VKRAMLWHRKPDVYPNGSDYVRLYFGPIEASVSQPRHGRFEVTCGGLGIRCNSLRANGWEVAENEARIRITERAAKLAHSLATNRLAVELGDVGRDGGSPLVIESKKGGEK